MIGSIYKTKAIVLLLFTLLWGTNQAFAADDISFTANAPKSVEKGQQFDVSFTINTNTVNDFRAPSFDGLEVLIGPSRSINSHTSIVNGKTTQVNRVTYTYILMANNEGTFKVGSASATVKGTNYSTDAFSINVLPAGSPTQSGGGTQSSGRTSSTQVTGKDLFILGNLSKTKVYEQEAVLLTYKMYVASVSVSSIRPSKLPDFTGFHSQELDLTNRDRWDLEHYNGRNYRTAVLQQVVLFPQRSGSISIAPSEYEVMIEQPVDIDSFDSFFNMRASNTVRKTVTSPSITLNVAELPAGKPSGFSGGVGEFTMTSSISANSIKANEALTIKVVISGTGNLKLISNPTLDLPTDFEIYDPKVEDQFSLTANGLKGNKVVEYLVIPRHEGNYTIPSATFSYFDLASKSYKTLSTNEFKIAVAPGAEGSGSTNVVGNYTNREDLKLLAEDIRFIKMNEVDLHPRSEFIKGSLTYKLFFIIPSLVFIAFILLNLKRAKENSNVALVRTKKANKMAKSRMKNAEKLLKAGNKDLFYDEVLRALWGYISDKLTIPISKLSKDNIEDELNKYDIDPALIADFIRTLNECEFAKFAPGDENLAMDKIFHNALDIIGNMENSIKH